MSRPGSNGTNVSFDSDALERDMQRILMDREQSRGIGLRTSKSPRSPGVGHSSRSSITVFDDSGGGTICSRLGLMCRYLNQDVETRHTDLLLLICTFASGMLDSAAFNAWGSFANMQTGNVMFLALGVSNQPPRPSNRWAEALVAIVTFMVGNIFFVKACRWLRPLRRSTMIASFALQTVVIAVSSVLVQTGIVDADIGPKQFHGSHWMQIVPIALLAFQAAGQIVTSRLVGVDEMPTLVVTTVLCDMLIDPNLLGGFRKNPSRNRRVAMFIALFLGAMVSGILAKEAGLSCPLWIAAALKAVVTVCWMFWWGTQPQKERQMV